MRDIDRNSVRTYVYLAIVLYFAILVIGGWLSFVVEALDADAFLEGESVRRMDELRLFAMRLLFPLSRFISGGWRYGASLLLVYPLVSLGFVLALVAVLFFSVVDFIRALFKK